MIRSTSMPPGQDSAVGHPLAIDGFKKTPSLHPQQVNTISQSSKR